MSNQRNVTIDGRTFSVRAGDVLLDAALANGVNIPHDCRAGACGSCMVHVVKGQTVCGESSTQGMVYACQARVVSDLAVEMEEVPEIGETRARLSGVRELAPDVVELVITPEKGVTYLPGQYFRFTFNGFPARPFSPTVPLNGRFDGRSIYLNVKRVRGGRVSPCLGTTIRPGHRLRLKGPYGHAFLRAGGTGRLVLVGSGCGFAPIWSVACMALRENRDRPIVLIAGARRLEALYMKPALARVSRLPNVKIIPAIEEGPSPHPMVRIGRLEAHVPDLYPTDIVYACGSPRMVTAVAVLAEAVGATFYADPFEACGPKEPAGILGMLKTLLQLSTIMHIDVASASSFDGRC
jgi:3-phenylpropionate/trans-cinnamate dioxygenase ferredoxin reductase subunit